MSKKNQESKQPGDTFEIIKTMGNKVVSKCSVSGRVKVETHFTEETLTQQQFKDQCDVNNIMKKYLRDNDETIFKRKEGVYADLTAYGETDYLNAHKFIDKANDAFFSLPAKVKNRFKNNPAELLAFLSNPANRDEAVSLGLIDLPSQPETKPVDEVKKS